METSHLLYVKRVFLELEQDGPVSESIIAHFYKIRAPLLWGHLGAAWVWGRAARSEMMCWDGLAGASSQPIVACSLYTLANKADLRCRCTRVCYGRTKRAFAAIKRKSGFRPWGYVSSSSFADGDSMQPQGSVSAWG